MKGTATLQKINKRNWSYVTKNGNTSPTNYHQIIPGSALGETIKLVSKNGYATTFRYW